MPGPNNFTEGLFEIADVVGSRRAPSGEILVNIGDAGRGTGIDSDVAAWGTPGFFSWPVSPTKAAPIGSEQVAFYADGNHRRIFGRRDRRYVGSIGNADEGDAVVHGLRSGARLHVDDSAASIELETATTPTNYRIVLSATGVDVTGVSTSTQSVALYPALQDYVNALDTWVAAAQDAIMAMLPIVIPAESTPGPLTIALTAAKFALDGATSVIAADATGSSAILRASPA
jgi:hypothetical protein